MLVELKLDNFRNYTAADLVFSPGLNVVLGGNGSGKTSLLEAIYFIGSGGRSFRSGRLSRLVRDGQSSTSLFAVVKQSERLHRLGVRRSLSALDSIRLDGVKPRALSELAALLPVLALHPESVELVFGPSAGRRRFLDWGMFHVEQHFLPHWSHANAALKQRNALLRAGRVSPRELHYWDQQLAASSDSIEGLRDGYLSALANEFYSIIERLSPGLDVTLALANGLKDNESYAQALLRLREDDQRRGFTQVGFHRADIRIAVNGRPAKDFLSRGQAKIVAYALVLAQLPMIAKVGKHCTLLVDDLGAELDAEYRQAVLDIFLSTGHQVVMTGLDAEQWRHQYSDISAARNDIDIKMFHVEHGKIRPLKDR